MRHPLYIFDCDGTLVNTETVHIRLQRQVIAEMGLQLSEDYMREHVTGHRFETTLDNLRRSHNLVVPDNAKQSYSALFRAELAQQDIAMPHARDVLNQLSAETKICVASNGSYQGITRYMQAIDAMPPLLPWQIFSAVDLGSYKPAPDLFLHAMREMEETNPADIAVIEDSVPGLNAALAAGMKTYWLRPQNLDDLPVPEAFSGRVTIIDSLAALL